ncbi:hypothetical protein E2C01_058168 [Portunus trituberculatus]|uniref:Uncharacterized protein n=1 Tax=Portunus trituberculatus TaxID=210409 RepID=A0A5B7H3Z8_PORTR|nr:hypothetical protein [Portunus trituberculatus]
MQVDKAAVIGSEASQWQYCKGGAALFKQAISVPMSCLTPLCSRPGCLLVHGQSQLLPSTKSSRMRTVCPPDWQLCGVTDHCTMPPGPMMCTITVGGVEKLPAFVADVEEPCLMELNSLV